MLQLNLSVGKRMTTWVGAVRNGVIVEVFKGLKSPAVGEGLEDVEE